MAAEVPRWVKMFLVLAGLVHCISFAFAQGTGKMAGRGGLSAGEPAYVTTQELIDHADKFDGRKVFLKGEAIGDVLPRGQWSWVNIQDDSNVIGVLLPRGIAEQIVFNGDYNNRGDVLEASGIFFRADPLTAGELCVRAQGIKILKRGYMTFHVLHPEKIKIALLFVSMVICLGALRLIIKKKADY